MSYHSITTLLELRAQSPCEYGWEKLLKHLCKTKADDEPLPLLTVLDSNGLDDALWCLRCPSLERLSRHFQAWCAEQVLPIYTRSHPTDSRVSDQITMLRNDVATPKERDSARDSAMAAARDSAMAAARDSAMAAARDSAMAAAMAAARDSARDSAMAAARDSAWAAARAAQERQLRLMIGQSS